MSKRDEPGERAAPSLLFDLDGTLIDSNYHVHAWREAFAQLGLTVPSASIHRCIGMSGELLIRALCTSLRISPNSRKVETLVELHRSCFHRLLPSVGVLAGSKQLLRHLTRSGIRWGIGTSGDKKTIQKMIASFRIPPAVPVITGDDVERTKPDPDVFLEAARRLGTPLADCVVIGDSVWDLLAARRAKALGVGLLSGGYGRAELEQAGAYRVYQDPAELLGSLGELGIGP